MKKLVIVLILFVSFIVPFKARASEEITISGKCGVLMDSQSLRVLYGKNIHDERPVASISKIMTAIVAIENSNLDDYVTISKEATLQVGSSVYLKQGDKVKLRDLLYALLLRSGNDAAYAIAEHVGDNVDHFVVMMNELAKKLGMVNSTFENPSGLDETTRNISSAYDMALLMSHALNNPMYREINDTKVHKATTINNEVYVWENKHRLIKTYDYITGGKTGFTKLARRTLVTSAKKGDMELVVVTLDSSDDWNDHMRLFDYGFKEYELITILKKGIFEVKELDKIFYVDHNIVYPLSDNEINQYRFVVDFNRESKKGKLHLVKDNIIVFSSDISLYDKTNSVTINNFTIYDLGLRIIEFIRDMFW